MKTGLILILVLLLNGKSELLKKDLEQKKLSQILYAKKKEKSEGWSIYSINPSGLNEKIIIPYSSGMGEYNPALSPDGNSIIFNTYRYGGWKLAAFNINSEKTIRISKATNYFTNANYSPDGKKIVYEKTLGRSTHIYFANSDGSNEIMLTSEVESNDNRIPVWSPDGKSIVFYSEKNKVNDIYIIDIKTLVKKNLTENNGGNNFAPSISPNGKQIAFFSDRNGYLDLYTMDISGKNQTLLTKMIQNDNNKYNYYADSNTYWKFKNSWSPDGNFIVFSNATDNNIDLFTIHKNGNELKNITNSPQSEYTPTWGLINK